MRCLLLANGPGEAWGWALPVWRRLRKRGHQAQVALLPCPFSCGREAQALESAGVTVCGPFGGSFATVKALRRLSATYHPHWIVQLGGDLLFGLLSRRESLVACYGYGPKKGMKACDLVMAPRQNTWGALPVGDLARDSLCAEQELPWQVPQGKRLLLLPGSRPAIRNLALDFLRPLADLARQEGYQWRVPLSPFCDSGEVADWRDAGFDAFALDTGACTAGADGALTQPGTNTLQLMERGLPFVAAAPLAFAEHIPLSGLKGWIPKRGRRFLARRLMSRRKGFAAWPNRLAGRELCPELIGDYSPFDLWKVLTDLVLRAPRAGLREELAALARATPPGADNLVTELERRCRP